MLANNHRVVRLLAVSISNSFADLSADHKSLLTSTPGFIEAMHGLLDDVASCSSCAEAAKELLKKIGAFP
jgi:hypothetical protein